MKSEELRNWSSGMEKGALCIINADGVQRIYYGSGADEPGYEWFVELSDGKGPKKFYASEIKEIVKLV